MKELIEKLKKFIKKPTVERAIKTFIETFCSYVAVNILATDLNSKTAIYGLLAGAIGSAFSVAINCRKVK